MTSEIARNLRQQCKFMSQFMTQTQVYPSQATSKMELPEILQFQKLKVSLAQRNGL